MQEKQDLEQAGEKAFSECCKAQQYFSISNKAQADPAAGEAFFLHIANFLDLFQEAWLEIQRTMVGEVALTGRERSREGPCPLAAPCSGLSRVAVQRVLVKDVGSG
eukprot:Skav215504  [mRNA]  locus=scaffold165:899297:902896:- [translate_table: standard]